MSTVTSLTAEFHATGVQEVKNGFNEIAKAAAAAQRQTQVATQNLKDQARATILTDKQIAAEAAKAQRVQTQAREAMVRDMGLAAVALGVATKKVYEFVKSGAQIQYTAVKFDRLAKSVGTTGDAFLYDLRIATKGTQSDMALMTQGADLLQLGLAKDAKEAARLSRVMTALGMDTGELTLALANQSKRRLDQLGLSLTKFNEIEAKLKKTGQYTKEQAFTEAFMQTAEQTVMVTGNMADQSLGDFMRMEAGFINLWNTMKVNAPNMQLPGMMGQTTSQSAAQVGNTANWLALLAGGAGKADWSSGKWNPNTKQYEFDVSTKKDFTKGQELTAMDWLRNLLTGKREAPPPASTAEFRAGERANYGGGAGLIPTAPTEAAPIDYAFLIDAGTKLTSANQEIAASQQKINESFSSSRYVAQLYKDEISMLKANYKDGTITQNEYTASLANLNKEYASGEFSTKKKKEAVKDLAVAQRDANNVIAVSALKASGATDQQMMDFMLASGQITQSAYNQGVAQDKLAAAYKSGQISVSAYAMGIQNVVNKVAGMDGMSANSYIDIWITEHYQSMGGGIITWTTEQIKDLKKEKNRNEQRFGGEVPEDSGWSGGQLQGNWTLVGDRPGGGFVPGVSELISPWGYVYDSKTSEKILKSGMMGKPRSLAQAGDLYESGGNVSINKPPTYTTSSPAKNLGVGGGGGASSYVSNSTAEILSNAEAVVTQSVTTTQNMSAQVQAAVQSVVVQSNKAMQDKLDELIAVMVSDNPRAIGQAVSGEFAKMS